MRKTIIGLESSSIMPLVTITPLTQDCYGTIWDTYMGHTIIAHEDSLSELKDIFKFKANTFYSDPITRMEKVKDFSPSARASLKGMALKLLLDGQMGGWVGNKNSRVQTFFFSDVIDSLPSAMDDPKTFSAQLIARMKDKIRTYEEMLTPVAGILTIDVSRILPYWGWHNVRSSILSEKRKLRIRIVPDCESFAVFKHLPSAMRRDAYHYHMLKEEKVALILVGDANYRKNVCSCEECRSYDCQVSILKDTERKKLLKLL
jgi:hypothetical protein